MPRHGRFLEGSGPFHLTVRGTNKRSIFHDDRDNESFIAALGRISEAHEWSCLAYCLMVNHVHLVVKAEAADISAGMRLLLGGHAQRFNIRHGQSGHVFGNRYHHVVIADDRQLLATLRYVALNPVRAGLCERPEDWPWSSYAAIARGVAPVFALDVNGVLTHFQTASGHPADARRALERLVEDGLTDARAEAARRRAADDG